MDTYKKIDLRYNNAHRLLPDWCYMTDIDAVEVRGTEPVAFIEYKQLERFIEVIKEIKETKKLTWQLEVYKNIANKVGIPVFFVGYSGEQVPCDYYVWKLGDKKITKYNLEQYQEFLKDLK